MSIDGRMDKEDVIYMHNGILLSHRKEWNSAICGDMDEPRDYQTEWSIRKGMTDTMWYHLHVESIIRCKLRCLQNKNRLTDVENRLMVAEEEDEGAEGRTGSLGLAEAN